LEATLNKRHSLELVDASAILATMITSQTYLSRKALKLFLPLLLGSLAAATCDAETRPEIQRYIGIVRQHILKDYKGMFKPAKGALKYPFITPGSSQYQEELWDWDSWLSNVALRQILLENGTAQDRDEALQYERGCVLNFLEFGNYTGWLPIRLKPNSKRYETLFGETTNVFAENMHKPCLAQHAAFLTKLSGGDAEWIREKFYPLQAFVNCYYNHYRHKETGLYFWQTDVGIGVDNDPSTFYRPDASSGSILLNCLMYKELKAMVYLADRLNMDEIGKTYDQYAGELLAAIREHCWDPRDGFYYSVDLNLRPYDRPETPRKAHVGGPRTWNCLIQRMGVWSGFLAMWAEVATPEQAKLIVEKHYRDQASFNAPYGVRTLSRLEKMYDVRATGNPSNWLGPIWINANYLTFRGLVKYGYNKEARELAEKTIKLLGADFEKYGGLHEYYLPENGEPVLNKGFQNWNYLVLNMIAWYEGKPCVEEF
jgi:putative isomerase